MKWISGAKPKLKTFLGIQCIYFILLLSTIFECFLSSTKRNFSRRCAFNYRQRKCLLRIYRLWPNNCMYGCIPITIYNELQILPSNIKGTYSIGSAHSGYIMHYI